MNIIKHISIPAATLALLTAASSCQQDELTGHVDDNAQGIRFTAYTDAVTRGAEVTSDNLGSFKVYAFGDGSASQYDWDDTFTGSGNSWTPASSITYRWPGDGTALKFYAYNADAFLWWSPSVDEAYPEYGWIVPTMERDGAASGGLRTTLQYYTPEHSSEHQDLVVAYATGDNNANNKGATPVALNFKHALARIDIKFENSQPDLYKVEIYGIKLKRYKMRGTFSMPAAVTSADNCDIESCWTLENNISVENGGATRSYDRVIPGKDASESILTLDNATVKPFANSANPIYMIPQTTNAWNAPADGIGTGDNGGTYIAVQCAIYQKMTASGTFKKIFPNEGISASNSEYGWTAVGVPAGWKPGKRYTYTLSFFKDGGGAGVTPPKDNDNSTADDDLPSYNHVVGGKLTWTVTVDGWGNASGNIDYDNSHGSPAN